MRCAIRDRKRFIGLAFFCLNVLILGVIVRLPWISFISVDYIMSLKPWYYTIVDEGLAVWEWGFSNYNVPYLYLLTLATVYLPNLSPLIVVKAISIIFDFVLAFFVYKCARFKYKRTVTVPCLAALVTLLAPFVILNGSVGGQADSIYTAFLIACLYALLRERQAWAFIAFGLSFSIKFQAIFLAPLFLWLLMKKQVKWHYSFLSLLVYLILLLPAWFMGRSLGDLFLIYFRQLGVYESFSVRAPNLYQWIPITTPSVQLLGVVTTLGVAFTILVVLILALFVYKSRVDITPNMLVHLATFSTLIVPFLLPRMHDRYFYPASVIAIVFAFYFPKYWFIPVVTGLVSSLAVLPILYEMTPVPLPLLAVFLLLIIAVLGWKLLRTPEHQARAAIQTPEGAVPGCGAGWSESRGLRR